MPAGPLGLAAGVEFRCTTYLDDRDPRLDGKKTFVDHVTGAIGRSDVAGSSDTPDTFGKRKVISLLAEVAAPLVSPDMKIQLVESLELQVVARFEDYDDVGDITKPRIAMSWSAAVGP